MDIFKKLARDEVADAISRKVFTPEQVGGHMLFLALDLFHRCHAQTDWSLEKCLETAQVFYREAILALSELTPSSAGFIVLEQIGGIKFHIDAFH